MKIIIVGAGKVGFSIAEKLSKEDHEITVIDQDSMKIERIQDSLDVMAISGNGVRTKVLLEAGITEADLLLAVTNSDEINMVCCLTAKRLGVKGMIARVRDPEYAEDLSLLKDVLELDMVINPEEETAHEIARIINFPNASRIEEFAKGKVKLVELTVVKGMSIANKDLIYVGKSYKAVLVGVVIREGQVIIPKGDFVIKENDMIYVIGKSKELYNFCKGIIKTNISIKNIMILGGGRIGFYLAKILNEMGMNTKIIEINKDKCMELADELENTLIINGDGTDEGVLKSENIEAMDAFVSLTGIDEENLIASMLAQQLGVEKCITKLNRENYYPIAHKMGISSVISPKLITSNRITRFVRGNAVETLYQIINGQAEIIELIAGEDFKQLNRAIKEVSIKSGVLLATIIRNSQVIIPRGNDVIKNGDRVILITMKEQAVTNLNQLIK